MQIKNMFRTIVKLKKVGWVWWDYYTNYSSAKKGREDILKSNPDALDARVIDMRTENIYAGICDKLKI